MSSSATNTASTEVVGSSTSPTPPKKEEQTPNAKNETTAPKPKENQSAQNDSIVKSEEKENKTPVKATEERETEKTPPVQSPEAKENGASSDGPSLRQLFRAFSKFGDTKSDGKHLTLSQSDKWMKQAKVIDGKSITTTDTAIHFKKFKQMKISFPDYEKYLDDLAKAKNIESQVLKNKLKNCGLPGTTGTTAVVKNQAVDRLTDTKKFTGSHKIRVDSPQKPKAGSPSPRK